MLVVYGIKSCDTCRRALKFLNERDLEHRFHDVRTDGLDIQMLERWSDEVEWEKLVNKKSLTWRKIPETDRDGLNRNKALALILDNPTLMKRPIFEADGFFALGFSEKRFADFLDQKAG